MDYSCGIIILILGVLAGIASNNMQYMIAEAAPEARTANGMFLTSANLGTTIGTATYVELSSQKWVHNILYSVHCSS